MHNVLSIHRPDEPCPLILDSPHSGHTYPDDFDHTCPEKDLIAAEDNFVDELFENAPDYGAYLLTANFPRSYIDVNRPVDDIDPQLYDGAWPYDQISPTHRSNAGIGLIRRLLTPGQPMYDRKLTPKEILNRIKKYYRPYHTALETLINEAHYNFGTVWHINCHSMPADLAKPKRTISLVGNQAPPVDFVLGNRDGTTCCPNFTRAVKVFLENAGYHVAVNDPFKGVELVERYSDPLRGRHSLQIEINKALYMDESTGQKNKNFKRVKKDLEKLIQFCVRYTKTNSTLMAAD